MSRRVVIKWHAKDGEAMAKIRQRFALPHYTTVNGLTPAEISDEDWELFQETAKRGFFSVIDAKWQKNGDCFSFIFR